MRLGAIYGHVWTSRHASPEEWEITKDEWGQGLGEFCNESIKFALDYLRQEKSGLPPTLPKFIEYCKLYNSASVNKVNQTNLPSPVGHRIDITESIAQHEKKMSEMHGKDWRDDVMARYMPRIYADYERRKQK